MKMRLFFLFILMPVLLITMISNNHCISGVKSSLTLTLTLTELDISDQKVEEIFPVIVQVPLRSFAFQPRILFENSIRLDFYDKSNISNTSLNFLYLAHSPPFHS